MDKKKYIIGIDPSIRSTGVCVWDMEEDKHIYYLITAHATKKLLNRKELHILQYEHETQTGLTSIGKEIAKTKNVRNVVDRVESIIYYYRPEYIVMEAVAFAANGTIDALAGINYGIRMSADIINIPIYVIPPTTIKMESVGNGQATKEMMIETWLKLEPYMEPLRTLKCDDLADAYFMAHFPKDKIQLQKS